MKTSESALIHLAPEQELEDYLGQALRLLEAYAPDDDEPSPNSYRYELWKKTRAFIEKLAEEGYQGD